MQASANESMIPRSLKDFDVAPLTWFATAGSPAGLSTGVGAREKSLIPPFNSGVIYLNFFLGTANNVWETVPMFLFLVSFILGFCQCSDLRRIRKVGLIQIYTLVLSISGKRNF